MSALIEETVAIYRNRKSGNFRIQPFAWDENGLSQPSGKPTHISADDNDKLSAALFKNLEANSSAKYRKTRVPMKEIQRCLKEDQLLEVKRERKGKYWSYRIITFKRMQSSFGSADELVVSDKRFTESGIKLIRKTFENMQ